MARVTRKASVQAAVAAVVAGLSLAGTASAAVVGGNITFTNNNNTGNGDLLDTTNWNITTGTTATVGSSGTAPDWTIGDTTVATGDWGPGNTTNGSNRYISSLTFDRSTDFTINSMATGTQYLYINGGSITVKQAHTYTINPPIRNFNGTGSTNFNISLAGGSTLVLPGSLANDTHTNLNLTQTGTGTGTIDYRPGGIAAIGALSLGANTKMTYANTTANYTSTITALSGSGEVQDKKENLIVQGIAGTFTGTVRSSAISLGNTGYVYFNTSTSTASAYTFTGGKFAVDTVGTSKSVLKSVVNGTFQGSEFDGSGQISFTDKYNSVAGSAAAATSTIRKMTALGSTFNPGDGSTAGTLEIFGNLDVGTYNSANSKLHIDILSGTSADQLILSPTSTVLTTPGGTDRGGKISSGGDANLMKYLDLEVALAPTLTQADVTGKSFTIITSNAVAGSGFTFAGSSFGNDSGGVISWTGGQANVTYGSNTVTLSSIVVPEPSILGLAGAVGFMALARRQRKA